MKKIAHSTTVEFEEGQIDIYAIIRKNESHSHIYSPYFKIKFFTQKDTFTATMLFQDAVACLQMFMYADVLATGNKSGIYIEESDTRGMFMVSRGSGEPVTVMQKYQVIRLLKMIESMADAINSFIVGRRLS